ncbi:Hypothetical protein HVR_LOCUS723 [uncultured virus]|nr:Hypothetical protein HVR_LOCUS723 [uncultured virus]
MSTVVPKLLHSTKTHGDVPVWEITTGKGHKIYYERKRRPGYLPIGCLGVYKLGESTLEVYDVANPRAGKDQTPTVYLEKDGYRAPSSWYERDESYLGPSVPEIVDEDFDYYQNSGDEAPRGNREDEDY